MADGRKNNGGARKGAGRKTKAEELGLAELIDSVWSITKQKSVLRKLAADCNSQDFKERHEARKLLLAYKFGQPTASQKTDLSGRVIFGWEDDAEQPDS